MQDQGANPVSKKRRSETELNQDNYEQVEEQITAGEQGEQERAPPEVLKQRRKLKVKSSTTAPEKPKTENPFKSINFAENQDNVEKKSEEKVEGGSEGEKKVENSTTEKENETKTTLFTPGGASGVPFSLGTPGSAFGNSTFGGFGAVGAGTSSFVFGGDANKGTPPPATPTSAAPFTFGLNKEGGGFGSKEQEGGEQDKAPFSFGKVFQKSGDEQSSVEVAPLVNLGPVQDTVTGEEDDQVLFTGDGNLYKFEHIEDKKVWKQRKFGNKEAWANQKLTEAVLDFLVSFLGLKEAKEGSASTVSFGVINFDGQVGQYAFKLKDPQKVEQLLNIVNIEKSRLAAANGTENAQNGADQKNNMENVASKTEQQQINGEQIQEKKQDE